MEDRATGSRVRTGQWVREWREARRREGLQGRVGRGVGNGGETG